MSCNVYHRPQTLMQLLIECSEFLEIAREDKGMAKEDVVDSMEERISIIMGKLVALPTATSFSMFQSNEEMYT